jgi:hypothetical protein
VDNVSRAFLGALSSGHKPNVKVEVLTPGGIIPLSGVILPGSTVTAIKTQPIRRSCSIKIIDSNGTLMPSDANALLVPYGNELRIQRGIQFPDGTTEYAHLGIFEITDSTVTDSGMGVAIDLAGLDRADEISRSKLTDTYGIAPGTNVTTAIKALIDSVRPNLTFRLMATPYTTPLIVYKAGDDPWLKAIELGQMIGAEVFFDSYGICVVQLEPTPAKQAAVVRFQEGDMPAGNPFGALYNYTMTDLKRVWSNRNVPNNVIREGQGTGLVAPVRAVSQDTNPNSPTHIGSAYNGGAPVTDFVSDSKLLTIQQCQDAADAVIRLAKGSLEALELQGVPHPALDISDVGYVARAILGVGDNYVIDSITMPLDYAGIMDLQMRSVIS